MLLLGIDLGTSSIKVSVVTAETQELIASSFYPETEADIITHKAEIFGLSIMLNSQIQSTT